MCFQNITFYMFAKHSIVMTSCLWILLLSLFIFLFFRTVSLPQLLIVIWKHVTIAFMSHWIVLNSFRLFWLYEIMDLLQLYVYIAVPNIRVVIFFSLVLFFVLCPNHVWLKYVKQFYIFKKIHCLIQGFQPLRQFTITQIVYHASWIILINLHNLLVNTWRINCVQIDT